MFGAMDIFTYTECDNDPRKTWRALTIATDLNGDRVFSRMDNFQNGGEFGSTGGEYIFSAADGKHILITDEASGLGIMTIKAYDGSLC